MFQATNQPSRIFFAILVLVSLSVVAAPPPKEVGISEADINAHVAYVHRMVPFSKYNDSSILASQRTALEKLRERFPKYDQWMSEKPNPNSADVYERNVSFQQQVELVDDSLKEIRAIVQNRLEGELKQLPALNKITEKWAWLEARGMAHLKSVLTSANDSSIRGVIVGLAQLLDGNEKAQFFKLGNPQAQIEFVEKKGITTEQLRASAFRAEQVGLNRETITIEAVLDLVKAKLNRSGEIFASISYLKAIHLANKAGEADISRVPTFLTPSTFDFAFRANSDFLGELAINLAEKDGISEAAFFQQMRAFQSNLPKKLFKTSTLTVENKKLVASIYEVQSHLAIYRGCIGGDCSTTRSAFYPYSPWEHVFYIKNERNEFVGYASVTRVKSKGVDTFYLKDLTGAYMSPDVARAAMFAFRQMISAYGAKRFAIAAAGFTDSQNHNRSVVRMLSDYNRSSDRVTLDFQDSAIRKFLRTEVSVAYQTNSSYDAPESHKEGVLLKAREPEAIRYAVDVKAGGLPEYSAQEIATEFKRVIHELIVNERKIDQLVRILSVSELEEAVRVISNKGGSTWVGYQRMLTKLFSKYELKFDREWIEQDPALFTRGFLRVNDIMEQSPKMAELALRYFYQSIHQSVNLIEVQDFFAKWKSKLYHAPAYKEAVRQMGQRLNHQDVYLLFAFAEQNSQAARSIVQNPQNRSRIESALAAYIKDESEFDSLTRGPKMNQEKVGIGALGYAIENVDSYTRKELKSRIAKILKEFGMKRADIQSGFIQNRFDIAFLFAKDSFDKGYLKSHRILQEKLDKNLISRLELLHLLSGLDVDHLIVARQIQQRVNYLLKTKSQEDILELQALHALNAKPATKALSTLQVAPEVEQVIKTLLVKEIETHEDAPSLSKESYGIFKFIQSHSQGSTFYVDGLRSHLDELDKGSAEVLLDTLKEWFTEFGARTEVALSWPVTMKLISNRWLSRADAFNSKDPKIIEYSLKFLAYQIRAGRDDLSVWKTLIPNIRYVRQSTEFKNLVSSVQKNFDEGSCANCGRALILLSLSGAISNQTLRGREAVVKLLASEQPVSKIFALIQSSESREMNLINENVQLDVIRAMSSGFDSFPEQFVDLIKEKVLAALRQTQGNSSTQRVALLDYIAKEPINSHALAATEIFMAQGGDAKRAIQALTTNYPRRELEYDHTGPEAEIFRKLKNLEKLKESNRLNACRSIFR